MSLEENLDRLFKDIKSNLIYLNDKKFQNDDNYAMNFLEWIKEVTNKNKAIYYNKINKEKTDHETFKKYRQHVYWINLGKNIGSEFNDYHYAVVIRESVFTAIIVPISTVKEETPDWKANEDLIIPIGELIFPNEEKGKSSYAMINQMQVVSKKRLDRCGNKSDGYFNLELTNPQMNLIDETIKKYLVNN